MTTTMASTGMSISLPEAGTYLITSNVRFGVQSNYATMQLHDDTAGVYVGHLTMGHFDNTGTIVQTTTAMSQLITVTQPTTISLHAKVNTVTATGNVYSDSAGDTIMNWVRVA
jgi:hypothetical protein